MRETIVNKKNDLSWIKNEEHKAVYYKDCVSPMDAKNSGIGVSRVMYEKLEPNGQVLPHTHNVGEIIYVTSGEVSLLLNGEWKDMEAGDTFIVPAGNIHSVRNRRADIASEQVSSFIPMANELTDINMCSDLVGEER